MVHGKGHRTSSALSLALVALAAASGCVVEGMHPGDVIETTVAPLAEGFESGSKTSYAAADATLSSGVWNLDDALIGTLASDVKTGAKSGRIRNSGRITMRFDRSAAGTVTVHHASFGSDASGTWALFDSLDGGATWTQVGAAVTTGGGALATATFPVNLSGPIRFEIRKLDGGTNRINIDDIAISGGDDGGGGGGGTGGASISLHTTLGLPSPSSTSDPNSYLSVKSGYVISYNSSRKVPNWVSWELNTSYLGDVDRSDDFRADDTLPPTLPQAQLADYSGSGFDRGHMCPSADRTLTPAANSQTFYLSTRGAHAANNTRGPWGDLENELRSIARTGKELFVISGGVFSASSLRIGTGVWVPDKTFKVAVVLDAVGQGAADVTAGTRVIAVMMPNSNALISASADWHSFRVSVDAIEAATGQNFLSDVDPAVQAVVESRVDNL